MKKIMLLGSGELGKEVIISAQRLGCHVIAVDRYENAPGMQVADQSEVINMLDEHTLKNCINKYNPDIIVPEIEAIRTEVLLELEKGPTTIIPTARATNLTMNRDKIRDLAKSLGVSLSTISRKLTELQGIKLGNARQSRVLFQVDRVNDYLESLSFAKKKRAD